MREYYLENNLEPYALIIYDDAIIGDAWEMQRYYMDMLNKYLGSEEYDMIRNFEIIDILEKLQELNYDDDVLIKIDYFDEKFNLTIYEQKEKGNEI